MLISNSELKESLKQRRKAESERVLETSATPEYEAVPDAGEATVDDVSVSYLQSDTSRVMKDVPAPTLTVLSLAQVYSGANGTPAMALLTKHFSREGRIDGAAALRLLRDATAVLRREPNCVEVAAPCDVFGDVHGQFFDLLTLIRKAGAPK